MNFGNHIERGPMAGDRFTQISNALFRDPRLSLKAKGLFGLISTHRDGFGLSIRSIARSVKESKDAVGTGLKELEEFGYLERVPKYDGGKFAGYVYRITDVPAHLYDLYGDAPRPGNPDTVNLGTAPRPGNPDAEDPDAGNPDPEDPHTKKTTTKKIKNEEHQDEAPSARSAADVRRTGAGSSARVNGGSAAAGNKLGLTGEQMRAVRAVGAALPRPLLAALPGQRIPGNNHRAVLDALEARSVEQVAERISRRWVSWGFEPAFHDGEIRNVIGAAVALIGPTPHCPDPSCEDGVMVDTGADCRACVMRRAIRRAAFNRGEDPRRASRTSEPRPECVDCGRPLVGDVPGDGMCKACRDKPAVAVAALRAQWAAEDGARAEAQAIEEEAARREARAADEARRAADEHTEPEAEADAHLRAQIACEAPYLLAYSQSPQQGGPPPF